MATFAATWNGVCPSPPRTCHGGIRSEEASQAVDRAQTRGRIRIDVAPRSMRKSVEASGSRSSTPNPPAHQWLRALISAPFVAGSSTIARSCARDRHQQGRRPEMPVGNGIVEPARQARMLREEFRSAAAKSRARTAVPNCSRADVGAPSVMIRTWA